MIDLHCHILPGFDDGAKNPEEAIEMARLARAEGIESIVATPHLFRGNFGLQSLDSIHEKCLELCKGLMENHIHIDIFPGAEVHISHNLIDEIKKWRQGLCLNRSSYMFVEFPSDHIYPRVKNLFFDLMVEGITPIIAHPERNSVLTGSPALLYELVQMGARAQANSGSFLGLYGRKAEGAVFRFLEWNLVQFIASDSHSAHSNGPGLSEAVKRAETIIGKERAHALVQDNPRAVLENRELPHFYPPVNPLDSKKTFSIKIPKFFRRGE